MFEIIVEQPGLFIVGVLAVTLTIQVTILAVLSYLERKAKRKQRSSRKAWTARR